MSRPPLAQWCDNRLAKVRRGLQATLLGQQLHDLFLCVHRKKAKAKLEGNPAESLNGASL